MARFLAALLALLSLAEPARALEQTPYGAYTPGAAGIGSYLGVRLPAGSSLPIGLVANRVAIADGTNTNKYAQSKTVHTATTNTTQLGIVVGNYYVPITNGPESYQTADATVTAYVEYPTGTCTQIKFGGATTGTVPGSGTLVSDLMTLPVAIPKGTNYPVYLYWNAPSGGIVLRSQTDTTLGDRLVASTSPLPDLACGTIANSGFGSSVPPIAIIGPTADPSIILVGDSIGKGLFDVTDNNYGSGFTNAAIIPSSYAVLNLSSSTYRSFEFTSGFTGTRERQKLYQYATTVVSELGTNDIHASYAGTGPCGTNTTCTAAQTAANLASLYALFPANAKIIQATIASETPSTAAWTTEASQSPDGRQSVVTALNAMILADSIPGQDDHFDTATKLTPSTNGYLWVPSTRPSVTDGATTAGTATLTSATANFVKAQDASCGITVTGAGTSGATLATILGIVTNTTTATMVNNAGTSNSGETITFSLTRDGTHPCPAGYSAIGAVDASKFR